MYSRPKTAGRIRCVRIGGVSDGSAISGADRALQKLFHSASVFGDSIPLTVTKQGIVTTVTSCRKAASP